MTADENFSAFSAFKLRQLSSRIETCLGKLSDEQIWMRGNQNSNSVGNLCLHLSGNVRQWVLHGVAGQPDSRQRDAEFAARGGVSGAELWSVLHKAVEEACATIEKLGDVRLGETIRPQNYDVTVLEAVYHVVEHFAQHTGQIVFMTKALTDADLGFYRHLTGARPAPPPAGEDKP